MKIIPSRTMFLDNRRVVAGSIETVSVAQGELALRMGWAIEVLPPVDFEQGAKDAKAEKAARTKAAK